MHLPSVDPPRRHRHHAGHVRPVLVEVVAEGGVGPVEVLAAGRVVAAHRPRVALELADHRARVDVVDADHPAPLRDDPEVHPMGLLPRVRGVPGPVQVQEDPVPTGPPRHRTHRGEADREVDHDDHRAQLLRELGPLVHLFHRGRGHVQVVALDLAGALRRSVDRLHAVEEPVPPPVEGLGVRVLVVLGEVEPAAEGLVDDPAVVPRRQAQLRLHRAAEERPPVLVEHLALDHDPVGRALERLEVLGRDPEVFEPQSPEGLEPEDVADDRRRHVGDRAFLEQIELVGDVGDVLLGLGAGDRLHPVALALVVLVRREPVRPHDRPGRRGRLPRHGRRRLLRLDAGLRDEAERGEDVGVGRLVVGSPVAHVLVGDDPSPEAVVRRRHRALRSPSHRGRG